MHVGDRARRVTFTLGEPVRLPPPRAPSSEKSTSPAVYVLGSVAAAAAVSFAAFGVAGYVQHRRLQDQCGPSCEGGRVDVVRTEYLVSDVSLGVSLVTAGVAVVLFLTQGQR
jgi:hypothetical protein